MLLGMIMSLTAVVLYLMYEILTTKSRVSEIEKLLESDDDDDNNNNNDEDVDIDITNSETFNNETPHTEHTQPAPVRRRRVTIATQEASAAAVNNVPVVNNEQPAATQ